MARAGSVRVKSWAKVCAILVKSSEVVDGVEPGQRPPAALRALRRFLKGPRHRVEADLYAALSDPSPVVVGYALLGLSEMGSRLAEELPRKLFARRDIVTEVLGDLRWRGTLGELASETQEACRAVGRDERRLPRGMNSRGDS